MLFGETDLLSLGFGQTSAAAVAIFADKSQARVYPCNGLAPMFGEKDVPRCF